MKHLKKYNESKEEIDLDYIEDCFIEFKDNSKYEYELGDIDENDGYLISIGVNILPTPPLIGNQYSIRELVEFGSALNNFYLDIENCFEKVKLKYPNIILECDEGTLVDGFGDRYLWIRFKN